MKKISLILILVVSMFATNNCEQFGFLGQSGIKGSEAKKRILDAANYSTILTVALFGRGLSSSTLGQVVILSIVIDGVVVPSLAGVSDSKNYKVETVDDCVSKIKSVGLILGNWIGAITCDLKTSPSVVEIGPIELF